MDNVNAVLAAGVVRTTRDVQAEHLPKDSIDEYALFRSDRFAEAMTQQMLRCRTGRSLPRSDSKYDQLLYVLSGYGQIEVGGQRERLAPGIASLIPAGTQWVITTSPGEDLLIANTSVPAPPGPLAASFYHEPGPWSLTSTRGAQEMQQATSDREFEILYDTASGSAGATQFVGFIPPSGAPEHYHLYEEFCVILKGVGALHAYGARHELGVGSTFRIHPGQLHSVENTGDQDLWLLGVFRPEGSAAAAFYPDGHPAPNNIDEDGRGR